MKVNHASRVQTEILPDEAPRMLTLLRERLVEANDTGESVLKLDPEDLRKLGSEADAEVDAAGAFRALAGGGGDGDERQRRGHGAGGRGNHQERSYD